MVNPLKVLGQCLKPLRAVKQLTAGNDVHALEAEVQRIRDEGLAATREVERLEAAKPDADTFDQVEQIERDIAKQRWLAERAAKRLPEAEARLAVAKAARQRDAIRRLQGERRKIYAKLRASIEAGAKLQAEAMTHHQAAVAELGEGLAARFVPNVCFGGLLLPDLVRIWTDENDRIMAAEPVLPEVPTVDQARATVEARRRKMQAPKRAPARAVPQAIPPGDTGRRAAAKPKQGEPPRDTVQMQVTPPRPLRTDPPPADGELQILVLRGGLEIGGVQCVAGDRVNVQSAVAKALAERGACELVVQA
jgi:hypothetical protein